MSRLPSFSTVGRTSLAALLAAPLILAASVAACSSDTSTSDAPDSSSGGTADAGDSGSTGDGAPKDDVVVPPPCASPKTVCGADCVDLASSSKSCGACDKACASGDLCVASKCTKATTFAVRKIFLGDTDRNGAKSTTAWKEYGENLDGLTSTNVANGECKPVAGAPQSSRLDGTNGIDNAWGHSVIALLDPFAPTMSATMTSAIEKGGRTPMIAMTDTQATYVYAEATSTPPSWNGTDVRLIAEPWTDGAAATTIFTNATLVSGVFDSGTTTKNALFSISLNGADWAFPIRKLRIRMKIDTTTGKAIDGMLSGIVLAKELEDGMQKIAGSFSIDLCSGSTIEGIKTSLRQGSDILVDGTQDPNKDCDSLSIGIGFEAAPAITGAVAPKKAPPADPCQ